MGENWKADAWAEAAHTLRSLSEFVLNRDSDQKEDKKLPMEQRRELAYISKVVASALERKAKKLREGKGK